MVGDSTVPIFLEAEVSDGATQQFGEIDSLSEQEVIYLLAALGANYCNSAYDPKMKIISDKFCKLDLKIVVNMWDLLDDRVKIRIVNSNIEKLKAWVNSSSGQE